MSKTGKDKSNQKYRYQAKKPKQSSSRLSWGAMRTASVHKEMKCCHSSQRLASLAGRILRDPNSTAIEKSLAGSILAQRRHWKQSLLAS